MTGIAFSAGFSNGFPLEVVNDVISGLAAEDAILDVCAKFGLSMLFVSFKSFE